MWLLDDQLCGLEEAKASLLSALLVQGEPGTPDDLPVTVSLSPFETW